MSNDYGGVWFRATQVLLVAYFRLLQGTVRVDRGAIEVVLSRSGKATPLVFTTPHSLLLPAVLAMHGLPATFLASQSRDGALVTHVLRQAGFEVARGSSSRGGAAGLVALLRALRRGRTVGVTHDGPKGPPHVPKPGIALLARQSPGGVHLLIPQLRSRCFGLWKGYIRLGSWDRFHVVLPFARIEVTCHELPRLAQDGVVQDQEFLAVLERLSRAQLADPA